MDDQKELKKQQEDYQYKFSKKKKDYNKLKGKGEKKSRIVRPTQRCIMLVAARTSEPTAVILIAPLARIARSGATSILLRTSLTARHACVSVRLVFLR
jgi:hypothetical protein